MSTLVVSTKKGKEWNQTELCKHILEYVGKIICYGPEEKFVLFIFRDSIRDRIFEEESTALYDMKSFQNPELVDQYFCWCCVEPRKTLVTRFKDKNIIPIIKSSNKKCIAINPDIRKSTLSMRRQYLHYD